MLFVFLKLIPKVPGPIVVSIFGIAVGYMSEHGMLSAQFQTLNTKFGEIGSQIIQIPSFSFNFFDYDVIKVALAVAVVAILETLISAKIADNMTKTKSNTRKEMLGLGLANIASGIFGGIPPQPLARTSLNVKSGRHTKLPPP